MEDAPISADQYQYTLDFGILIYSELASFVFMLMCIHYLYKCVSRRLWLFPCYPAAPFISLNAATLALLGFFIKTPPSLPVMSELAPLLDLSFSIMGSVLASALIGACMPSIATADRSQIWSNAAGAALLLMTIIFNVLYKDNLMQYNAYGFDGAIKVIDLSIIIICVSLAILVLIVQACNSDVMISEVAACISIRLQQLEIMDPKSISERGGLYRIGWEDLERRTYTKLMMGLTSNLQNVASRSPSLMGYTHALTTLLVRILKPPLRTLTSLPIKALLLCMNHRCASKVPALEDSDACLDAGVIHIAGEDPRTVHRLFAASAKLVIQRQIKKAATKPTIALETLLKLSTQACFFENSVVYEVLDERGIPDVGMLHAGCHYGDQYGWGLTALSLLVVMSKVELEALGTSKTTMAAMEAYEQARQMVQVVDEMHIPLLCSKETYLKVSASMWSSLLNKSRSWPKASSRLVQTNVSVVDILDAMLRSALGQFQGCAHVFPWAKEVVKAYTMYTVCHNLLRWCTNNAKGGGASQLVEHIEFLMAEVLAGCLCSLPAVLETRTRRAVRDGHVAEMRMLFYWFAKGNRFGRSCSGLSVKLTCWMFLPPVFRSVNTGSNVAHPPKLLLQQPPRLGG